MAQFLASHRSPGALHCLRLELETSSAMHHCAPNRESASHGSGRAGMLGLAVVAVWAITVPTLALDAAQVEAGRQVWVKGGCYGCHGQSGQGGEGGKGGDDSVLWGPSPTGIKCGKF